MANNNAARDALTAQIRALHLAISQLAVGSPERAALWEQAYLLGQARKAL